MRKTTFIARIVAMAFALTALLVGSASAAVGGGALFAYSVISNSEVNALWRKAQGKLMPGFNFVTPEFKWVQDLKDLDIDPSLREMTFPVDLIEDRGVTSLPEGGREAEPMTVNAVDATVQFIHVNARFTVSKRARWALGTGAKAAIMDQLKWSGQKKLEALGRVLGDMFYGYSTNYLCQVDDSGGSLTGASSHTIPIKNGFGDSSITNAAYIANLVKVGDRVALIASGALVTNSAFGEVTAVTPGTPSIGVTWGGTVDPDDDDYLVFSNGAGGTTIAHTSYNRGLTGLRDICTAASLHGIATSSYANWSAAYSDTSSGRFNGQKWRKGLDEMQDDGHEEAMPMTLMSKGVRRDVAAQYAAGVQFDDSMDMEIDGEPKARGKKFKGTKRVPPGMVVMFDQKRALCKKSIHEKPSSAPRWSDGKELIDDSGWLFAVETSLFMACSNRKLVSYFENQTEL